MFAVMAFSEPAHPRVQFNSRARDNALFFHGQREAPSAPGRAVAAEHDRMVTCSCVARTADRNELRRETSQAPIEWVQRMTFAACEAMDGKLYKPPPGVKTACGRKSPLGPSLASLAGAAVEPESTCVTYDPKNQPAFWYCQAAR